MTETIHFVKKFTEKREKLTIKNSRPIHKINFGESLSKQKPLLDFIKSKSRFFLSKNHGIYDSNEKNFLSGHVNLELKIFYKTFLFEFHGDCILAKKRKKRTLYNKFFQKKTACEAFIL